MNVIKGNGSYNRLIKFSDQFLVLDFSNKEVGIAVKTYISEEQVIKEFEVLRDKYNTERLIYKKDLDSMISGIY
jgi:hypothetical protein